MSAAPLRGQVALVTGGGKNIGRAIALKLAADGADVAIVGKTDAAALEETADAIRALGRRAHHQLADIGDEQAVAKMAEDVAAQLGSPQILVNNAAVRRQVPFEEMDFAEWRAIQNVILDGAFLCIRALLPAMRESGGGAVVNVSGLSAFAGAKNRAHVIAAKSGICGLTRALALDLSPHRIRVNCVAPGMINTVRGSSAGAPPQHAGAAHPLTGGSGEVDDIANMVAYLAGPQGKYITGQTIHINGGLYLT